MKVCYVGFTFRGQALSALDALEFFSEMRFSLFTLVFAGFIIYFFVDVCGAIFRLLLHSASAASDVACCPELSA